MFTEFTKRIFINAACVFGLSTLALLANQANATVETNDDDNPIGITTHISQPRLTVQTVNSDDFSVVVRLTNTSKEEITVSPFLNVALFDVDGKPVTKTTNLGRSGFRMTDSVLEGVQFVSIAAGESHDLKVNLKKCMNDPLMITGWQILKAGQYHLKLQYKFDRKQAKKMLGKGCQKIDARDQPWNRALEIDQEFEVELNVK